MELEFSVLCNEIKREPKTNNLDVIGIFRNLYIKGERLDHGYGLLFARVVDLPKGRQRYGIRLRGDGGYDMPVQVGDMQVKNDVTDISLNMKTVELDLELGKYQYFLEVGEEVLPLATFEIKPMDDFEKDHK